jgi:uncharacterized protein
VKLTLLPNTFAICRLPATAPLPIIETGSLLSVTRTANELSIVCVEAVAPSGSKCSGGWRCFEAEGPMDLSMTGVLVSIARPLAEAGVSIFAISTFDTDYVLVPGDKLEVAVRALVGAGVQIS